MAKKLLFAVTNHHVEGCGEPPSVTDEVDGVFRSYFENPFGEQWIFLYDPKQDRITVHSGDHGWDTELTVKALRDSIKDLPEKFAEGYLEMANSLGKMGSDVVCAEGGPTIIGDAEAAWVKACMLVVEARRPKR